jgi:hypothetical protein
VTSIASFLSDFWDDQLVSHGRQYLFLVLVGFVGSFGIIRISTRMQRSPRFSWWPGSIVSDGGVHVHHLVFGIFTMIAAGVASYALHDVGFWYDLTALAFGIGMGLTIDEFALFLYLRDVYWQREGRASIDATLLAAAAMGLILLGVAPFEVDTTTSADLILTLVVTAFQVWVVGVCFLKQRLVHGSIGLFWPPLSLYGACRIGKPNSPWARRFYRDRNPHKQAKSEHRFRPDRRTERFKQRVLDAVGGVPEDEYQARLSGGSEARTDT